MRALPTGTVTFLFTDVEGSTRLLEELGERYGDALAEHRRVLQEACERRGGVLVDTQGDATFYAFSSASAALAAADAAQRALELPVRGGLHTGEPQVRDDGYVGIDVHRAARICAAAHGGQVLVSETTARLAGEELRELGAHRLKDVGELRLYQLGEGSFPPPRSLTATNLPVPPTPLLGRKKELADVLKLLGGDARLVTVTGPGGTGKTRFALEVAAELVGDVADGVWFVDLSAVRDRQLVVPTIAGTLGAKVELAEHLGDKELVLCLDNFEQVAEAAPELAGLLERCPKLRLLVTSREPLHLRGEREYPLRPLAEAPAIELFRQRAQAIDPGFEAAYRQLAELCGALDHLPLAIELAAARTRTLTTEQLRERLNERLPLLSSRNRDLPARQHTLRATIEWSHDLLGADERQLFRRLSVFAGGFELGAAEQVAEADLDTLESLADKNLVRRERDRFTMLETIREFAGERLDESGEETRIRTAHARFFADFARAQDEALYWSRLGAHELLHRLEADQNNLRSALGWLRETGELEAELRLAGAMEVFWSLGHLREGRLWLEAALEAEGDVSARVRMRALGAAAHVVQWLGDLDAQERYLDEALGLARASSDLRFKAAFLASLAGLAILRGDAGHARELLTESEAFARDVGDERRLDGIATLWAHVALYENNLAEARILFERALARFEEVGNLGGMGITLSALGMVAFCQRLDDKAANLLLRSLRLHRDEMVLATVGDALEAFAGVLGRRGRPQDAVRFVGAADAWRSRSGHAQQPFERRLSEEVRSALADQLGDRAFAVGFAEGRALDITEAVALALSIDSP